jgi:hypothetical protein
MSLTAQVTPANPVTLLTSEIQSVTGYKRPIDQLRELHRQGFYRARISKVTGRVILERPHYDAVSAGGGQATNESFRRPALRVVQ